MSAGARGNQFSLAVDPFDHDTGAPLPFTTLPPQGRAIGSGDAYVNSRETERERERETERQRERARDRDRDRDRQRERRVGGDACGGGYGGRGEEKTDKHRDTEVCICVL
jgi:hypothetical protein